MSNFIRNTKHPDTNEFEAAFWLDDYYGPHRYAVAFKDGTVVPADFQKMETNDEPAIGGVSWDDYKAVKKHD